MAQSDDMLDGSADRSAAPIFIVGPSRSGTTLCAQILNNHPRLSIYFESFFLQRVARAFPDPIPTRLLLRRALSCVGHLAGEGVDPADLEERFFRGADQSHRSLFELILRARAENAGKVRFGEKMPSSFQHVDRLLEWFPRAKLVFVVRDPRDVHSSYRKSGEGDQVSWADQNVVGRALYWNECLRVLERVRQRLPDQVFKVSFRALVTDPETTVRSLCAFLDEPYSSEMLAVDRSNSSFDPTKENAGIRQNVLDRRSKLSRAETIAIELVCGEGMLDEQHAPALIPAGAIQALSRVGFYEVLRRGHAKVRGFRKGPGAAV